LYLAKNATTGWYTELAGGYRMTNVHPAKDCEGRGCAIHDHPSEHPLVNAPLSWRGDRGILERHCIHGVGHPDRDSAMYLESVGQGYENVHGCDGCCLGAPFTLDSAE
jgi:hypothetical protein